MGLAASERDVLKVIRELKTANRIDISQRIGLSSNYVEYLCKYLLRGGYLGLVGKGRYTLTLQGERALGHGLEEKSFKVDRKLIKDVASEVAKKVAEEVTKGIKLKEKEVRAYPVSEEEKKKKIEIKTDYVPPVEDETTTLESNIEEIAIETEQEKSDIDKSVERFKNINKIKKDEGDEKQK